jgi:hypothetical protein
MLAHFGIINQISMRVRKFLWQGGKSNEKKFHLVNWNQVKCSMERGGLGIRDLEIMSTAMGEKMLWRLIIGKIYWWKHVIWKKYFTGTRQRCLESLPKIIKASQFFNLLIFPIPSIC